MLLRPPLQPCILKQLMKYIAATLITTALLLFTSCKKDPEDPASVVQPIAMSVVKLTVKPVWANAPFDKNAVYGSAGGQRVQTTLLKFYLSPLELVANGTAQRLFDADLFDVTNGAVQRVLSIPAGNYQSLRLGLGLPPEINHIALNTIDPNAPTGSNSGMYWSWASMYRFVIFEGHFDNDLVATGPLPFNFSLHTGRDTCYRARTFPLPITATGADTTRITINVDVSRFFTDGNQVLDLSQGAVWHGEPDGFALGMKVADLEIGALSVEAE